MSSIKSFIDKLNKDLEKESLKIKGYTVKEFINDGSCTLVKFSDKPYGRDAVYSTVILGECESPPNKIKILGFSENKTHLFSTKLNEWLINKVMEWNENERRI